MLLKRSDDAGAHRSARAIAPPAKNRNEELIYPRAILGRIDNFKEPIALIPLQSWGEKNKDGIALGVSTNPETNQPSARCILAPTTSPVVLQIQYAVAESAVKAISDDVVRRSKYDGVTVLVTTIGVAYNQSTLLTLDPVNLISQRKWLSYNFALPTGTREIHFSIIAPPPNYNVFDDSCMICLPQLRISTAKTSPAPTRSSSP